MEAKQFKLKKSQSAKISRGAVARIIKSYQSRECLLVGYKLVCAHK